LTEYILLTFADSITPLFQPLYFTLALDPGTVP
jgi:hypothetical protein